MEVSLWTAGLCGYIILPGECLGYLLPPHLRKFILFLCQLCATTSASGKDLRKGQVLLGVWTRASGRQYHFLSAGQLVRGPSWLEMNLWPRIDWITKPSNEGVNVLHVSSWLSVSIIYCSVSHFKAFGGGDPSRPVGQAHIKVGPGPYKGQCFLHTCQTKVGSLPALSNLLKSGCAGHFWPAWSILQCQATKSKLYQLLIGTKISGIYI